jgi:hypothetical protein
MHVDPFYTARSYRASGTIDAADYGRFVNCGTLMEQRRGRGTLTTPAAAP